MTEAVAAKIANELGAQAFNINAADAAAFDAELLVLGSSTWGVGDLQDDWAAQLDGVKANFFRGFLLRGGRDARHRGKGRRSNARGRGAEARRHERGRPNGRQDCRVGRDTQGRALRNQQFQAPKYLFIPGAVGCRSSAVPISFSGQWQRPLARRGQFDLAAPPVPRQR